jgi:hypothetical protein
LVRATFIAKGRCLSVVSETRKVPFRARHSINRSPPKRKPVIGILAIAALASSAAINVAVAQQGPATERVEPTPLAGGGPGKLPSPGEGPAATIPSHPETGRVEPTPLAGGGPRTLPSPTATAPAAQPSRSANGATTATRIGTVIAAAGIMTAVAMVAGSPILAVRSGITTTTTPITRMAATITRHTARIATRCVASIRTMAGAHVASMCATSDILRTQ